MLSGLHYDSKIKEDVMKVRDVLRKLGIKQRRRYKAMSVHGHVLYGSKYTPKYPSIKLNGEKERDTDGTI